MARKAKVGYWKTKGAFGVVFNGKHHILVKGEDDFDHEHCRNHGPNYTQAVKLFADLQCYGTVDKSGDANTVRVLFERYAEYLEAHKAPATLKRFKREASHFAKQHGEKAIGALKPFHIDEYTVWLRTARKWTQTKFPLQQIKNAFVWGVKKKLITTNPFDGVKLEDHIPNTESQLIPRAIAEALIAVASPYLRDLIRFLWHTGCRPDEAYNVQAKHYDRESKCIVFSKNAKPPEYVWKNAKKTKRDRVIFLNDEMVEMVEAKIKKRPSGYLFVSKFGQKWNRLSIYQQIKRAKATHKIEGNITAYGFRHTYITNFLLAGGSIKVLADGCGTSVDMIEKTYSHISEDKQRMRELMISTMKNATSGNV